MFRKLLSVAAGLALLGSVSVASAKQPVVMTDVQLDKVTAGTSFAFAEIESQGLNVTFNGQVNATNASATVGSASAFLNATATLTGIAPHTLFTFVSVGAP